MERRRREDRVERSFGQRHVLEPANVEPDELGVVQPPSRDLDHVPSRLDRVDVQTEHDELLGQLSRSGANLDDPGLGAEARELDRGGDEGARVAGALRVVCLRHSVEHLAVPLRVENPVADGRPVGESRPVDLGLPTPLVLVRG